ncbi:MAG: VUT family protein, partial [Pseudomonadota bacterium]
IGPQHWPIELFLAVGTVNYLYKLSAAVALTPLIYLMRRVIDGYLGANVAANLKRHAAA